MKQHFKSMIHKASLSTQKISPFKLTALMVGIITLTACQSVSPMQTDSLAQANLAHSRQADARALFDDATSPAHQHKQTLTNALKNHLSSERYALGTYHYKLSPLHQAAIDNGADSLLSSVLKTYEYQQSPKVDFYRELGDIGYDEMYLRYDDELSEQIPAGVLTYDDAFGLEYINARELLRQEVNDFHDAIAEVSLQIDDLVAAKPTINTNDKAIQAQLDNLTKATKEFEGVRDSLIAGGYLLDDFEHLRSCAAIYDKGVRQVLSPNRRTKSYTGSDYDEYDLAYLNYYDCREVASLNMELDPIAYANASTKRQLDFAARQKQCMLTNYRTIQELLSRGKTYIKDGELFANSYIERINCTDNAIGSVLDEQYAPTAVDNLTDAIARSQMQYDEISYQEYAEFDNEVPNSKVASYFEDYIRMKTAEKSQADSTSKQKPSLPKGMGGMGGLLGSVLSQMKMTHEQMIAQNIYQNEHSVITALAHYEPHKRKTTELYSLDTYAPTFEYSVQLPVMADFERSVIKADVAALLPLVALVSPTTAPLPNELPNDEMTFTLPDGLSAIPMSLIYDASHQAMVDTFAAMNSEKITAIDISDDAFAKQIGAKKAYKVNFDAKEQGLLLGMMIKHISRAVNSYIDTHPDEFTTEKTELIKKNLANLMLFNDGYHTQDMGDVWQVIEGILPIRLHQSNYFYLNAQGKIIGMQAISSMANQMEGSTTQGIQQVRYADKPFAHPLSDKFAQSFQTDDEFDGTTWLINSKDTAKWQSQAVQARTEYRDGDDYVYYDENGNYVNVETAIDE